MSIEFTDNTAKMQSLLADALLGGMETLGGEMESQAKTASRVDTGQTKNSYQYKVQESGTEISAVVGSDYENAIWEEYGTGEFALEGNGRKTPWRYQDAAGNWHTTTGKTPNRPLFKAGNAVKPKAEKILASALGELK